MDTIAVYIHQIILITTLFGAHDKIMIDLNEIDLQLGRIVPLVQNNLIPCMNGSKTLLGKAFDVGGLIAARMKREASIYFKTHAFKVAYYLSSKDYVDKFLNKDELAMRTVWEYGELFKQVVLINHPKMSEALRKHFPETYRDNGDFENEFLACVYQLLLMVKRYNTGECVIPFYNNGYRYQSVAKDGFKNILVQTFAEDLMLSESFRIWEFRVNFYDNSVKPQMAVAIKYNQLNVNQYVNILQQGFKE